MGYRNDYADGSKMKMRFRIDVYTKISHAEYPSGAMSEVFLMNASARDADVCEYSE